MGFLDRHGRIMVELPWILNGPSCVQNTCFTFLCKLAVDIPDMTWEAQAPASILCLLDQHAEILKGFRPFLHWSGFSQRVLFLVIWRFRLCVCWTKVPVQVAKILKVWEADVVA